MASEPLLRATGVCRTFRSGAGSIDALRGVDIKVNPGEFLLLRGHSGSGKTTLLLTLGGMAHPTAGEVWLAGQNVYLSGSNRRRKLRRDHVGFVFQSMHLLPYLGATGNVALGGEVSCWLDRLGLSERSLHRPDQLSAGERQRVAVARALASGPDIILADEPTGNLDPRSAALVVSSLEAFRAAGGAVVMASHAPGDQVRPSREVRLVDGVLGGSAG